MQWMILAIRFDINYFLIYLKNYTLALNALLHNLQVILFEYVTSYTKIMFRLKTFENFVSKEGF
jgi:hypothetical protein